MEYTITYGPHRINCTAENTSPITVRYQFMPLYGPERWYDYEPQTFVSRTPAAGERSKEDK